MPILAENNGWSLYIYTPRGRNHGLTTLQSAQRDMAAGRDAFAQVLTVNDTGVIPQQILDDQKQLYIDKYGAEQGESFYEQEYLCSFNAANIGAILGRAIDRAEREGRINDAVTFDPLGAPIEISSDIGFRDTATWWFWQPKVGGFSLIDYMGDSGLDADDWIAQIQAKGYEIGKIWLPHDARAKTFQSKHSAVERFLKAFGAGVVKVVPQSKKMDRINAARVVVERCAFNETKCEKGLEGLREWSFEWNEDTQEFSKEPRHDWASHPGDGFSYGCQVMMERVIEIEKPKWIPPRDVKDMTLEELWEDANVITESRI